MADPVANPNPQQEQEHDWNRRESLGSAIVQIGLCALILGGGLYAYWHRQQVKRVVYNDGKDAREMVTRGNPKDLLAAKDRFTEALGLDSKDAFSTSNTALIEVLLWGQFGMADHQGAATEWVGNADDHGGNIDEHFTAAALYRLYNGKPDEAVDYLKGIAEKGGAGTGLFNAMGLAKRGQGKLDEARALLKKAQDQGWRNPRYADDLADSYFEDGDYVNAEEFYKKGIDAYSEHQRSLVGQARARIARGQNLKQADDALTEVLGKPANELTPAIKAMALTGQSELRRFEQKYDEAVKLADQAIAASGSYAWAYEAKGAALAAAGKPEAAAAFDKALALDKSVGVFYFEGARSMVKLKDGAKAEGYMAAYASTLKKTDDRYHVAYGDVLRDLGNPDKAMAEYNAAIQANGLNPVAHYNLGSLLLAKNDYDKATAEFTAALGARQNYPEAHVRLGDIKFAKKDIDNSLEEYAQALVTYKQLAAPRETIDALIEDIKQRLLKEKKKDLAKIWEEQAKQLVR